MTEGGFRKVPTVPDNSSPLACRAIWKILPLILVQVAAGVSCEQSGSPETGSYTMGPPSEYVYLNCTSKQSPALNVVLRLEEELVDK